MHFVNIFRGKLLSAKEIKTRPLVVARCRLLAVVSTGRRNTLSSRDKMECSDGSGLSSGVYYGREDGVMGSMAARGVAEGDRTSFWQAVIVDLFFFSQPAICSGDQSNLSFPATACRSRGLVANLQHFGRRAPRPAILVRKRRSVAIIAAIAAHFPTYRRG